MKRSEILGRLQSISSETRARIESAPNYAFVAGIIVGVLLHYLLTVGLLIPLFFIVIIAVGVLWLMSEDDEKSTP